MCFKREWFLNFVPFVNKKYSVKIGDGSLIDAEGRGDIKVKACIADGYSIELLMKDVLFVPEIEKNLVSISKCTSNGMSVLFERRGFTVRFFKDGKVVLDGIKEQKLYRLNIHPIIEAEAYSASSDTLMTWHERLGHVNFHMLRQMNQRGVVEDC